MRDDYLDCYGDIEVTKKIGNDIAEGKCTWLAVVALQRATKEQRKIFEARVLPFHKYVLFVHIFVSTN